MYAPAGTRHLSRVQSSGFRAQTRPFPGPWSLAPGFTLVEALVAIIIAVLVMYGVHQVFVAGLTTQTTTSSQADVDRRAQVAMDEITSMLRQAAPSISGDARYGPGPKPPVLVNYDATHPDRISFAGPPGYDLEPPRDGSGIIAWRYWLQSGCVMRRTDGNWTNYTGGEVLAPGVTELRFTFYDANGAATSLAVDTVRVGVKLTVKDGANWSTVTSSVRLRNT
ncbi:MAG: PilW family protein [Armatimonadota bacterium]